MPSAMGVEVAPSRVDILIVYSSQEARDGAVATPMADGMEEGYRRLDGLLPGWT